MNKRKKLAIFMISSITTTICAGLIGIAIIKSEQKFKVIDKNKDNDKGGGGSSGGKVSTFTHYDLSENFNDKILEKYTKSDIENNEFSLIFDEEKSVDLFHTDIVNILQKDKKFKYDAKDEKIWVEYKFFDNDKKADFVVIWSNEYNANWKANTDNNFYYDELEFDIEASCK